MNSRARFTARLGFESLEQRTLLSADPGWAFGLPGPAFDARTVVNIGPIRIGVA